LIIHQIAKKKHKKNITGLRNQSKTASHIKEALDDSTGKAVETAPDADVDEQLDNNEEWKAHIRLDSNKLCWELEDDKQKLIL
jgi:hypothetical protein